MWGKKVFDFVPDMDERRARSLEHLKSLATSTVKEVLGVSPQEKDETDADEAYQLLVQRWREEQAQLSQLSHEDYMREIASGRLMEPPTKHPKKTVDIEEWLKKRITDRLLEKIDSVLMDLVGIEYNYGSPRVKTSGGLMSSKLSEKAKKIATELADRWAEENAEKVVKEVSTVDLLRQFKYELETETKKAIVKKLALIAEERANHVRIDVLEAAVDHAMFESYPVLRRMEAAKRLDAKNEAQGKDKDAA